MPDKSKVIPFDLKRARRKATTSHEKSATPIVDISARRQEMIKEERRKMKRTILTEFIGASVIVPGRGLTKVNIYDISENGLSFDWDLSMGSFTVGEEVAVRVYINHQTFFPFVVKIQNQRIIDDEQVVRHGGRFLKETLNEQALYHFVKFVEHVSTSLEQDSGDIMVGNNSRR